MEPRILPLEPDRAQPAARAILEQTQRAVGMVPNLHRTLAHAPAALEAYSKSATALADGLLPATLREQIALTSAGLNDCQYCASAHSAIGKLAGLEPSELSSNLDGTSSDPKVAAALAFVRALIDQRGALSDEQWQAVRDAGFGDAEILEIVAHVALNSFTNTVNVLVGTQIDFPRVELRKAG